MRCSIVQGKPRKIVLVLPGLAHYNGDAFRTLTARLKECHRDIEVVNIVVETFWLKIDEQAKAVFSKLQKSGITKEDRLVLIGHSQGGLRAHALLKQFGKSLNIKGLVSIGTPWKGAPVINNYAQVRDILYTPVIRSRISNLNDALANCFNLKDVLAKKFFTNYQANLTLSDMIEHSLTSYFHNNLASPGVKDMEPGSDFLKNLEYTPETGKSVLKSAIIGGQNDIFAGIASGVNLLLSCTKAINMGLYCCSFKRSINHLRLALQEIQQAIDTNRKSINQKAADVLGDVKHDGLVPEYSQHMPEETLQGATYSSWRLVDAYHDKFLKLEREKRFLLFNRDSRFIAYKHPRAVEIIKAFVTNVFNNQ